jgi:hypothetical protein
MLNMGKLEVGAVKEKAIKGKKSELDKLIDLCKPFVGNLKRKTVSRPVLKTALITPEYVIATDSHRLIRIKHKETVPANYLHHYKKELTADCDVTSYPDISRILPETSAAQKEVKINVAEWLEAHELGLIAAKVHRNCIITLENGLLYTNFSNESPQFEDIAFKYILDDPTGIEKVTYNCEYMLELMKVLKKAKITETTLYFYGHLWPMYFIAGDIEALILPVRSV